MLINRPLNAFAENRMFRLADFTGRGQETGVPKDLEVLVEPLRQLERSLTDRLNVPLLGGPDYGLSGRSPTEFGACWSSADIQDPRLR